MANTISRRSATTIANLDNPWRFGPEGTYDAETNPSGLIIFSSATNFLVIDETYEFTQKNFSLSPGDLIYGGKGFDSSRLPNALTTHLNEYMNPHQSIRTEDIRIASGATTLHDILAWVLADGGDAILSSRPVYGRFDIDFGNKSEVKLVYADTTASNCFDEDVVNSFEAALEKSRADGIKVKALVIVNPHNPLGRCYPRATLVNIMKFCQKHQIHLISDEIYACSVFDSGEANAIPYTPVLSIDTEGLIDPELIHVEYGMSKDFGASGLRLGAVVTRNKAVLRAIDTVLRFYEPSHISISVAATMLEDREWCRKFIESLRTKLAKAYKHVTAGLREMGVEYLQGGNAGFFVWVNLTKYLPSDLDGEENAEYALGKKLKNAGVFLHPREENSLQPGWFRLVYTQDAGTVSEGLRRIKSVISA